MNFLRRHLQPPSARSLALIGLPAVLILPFYWLARAAHMRSDYTAIHYTPGMAFANACELGVAGFLRGALSWFLPTAAAAAVLFLCLRPGRARVAVAVASALLPAAFLVVAWGGWEVALLPLGPMILPGAVAGALDGETWGEGWVMLGPLGTWLDLWLLVGLAELARLLPSPAPWHSLVSPPRRA